MTEAGSNGSNDKKKAPNPDEEFATSTTMHGVYFCYSSQSKLAKILWSLLIIGMIAALISQVIVRIVDYFEYATSTDISEEFVSYLHFPAVTICSFNRFFVDPSQSNLLDAVHTVNRLTSPHNVAYMVEKNTKVNITRLDSAIENFNLTDFLDRNGFSISGRNMPRCIFKYQDCEATDFSVVYTSLGKCYTFNEANYSRIQNVPGAGHGLEVSLHIHQDMYTEEPLVGNREAGIKVQVHPQYEAPDVATYGISIPVGMKASIEMVRTDYNMMYEPWGKCDADRSALTYFPTYSLKNCMQECYTNLVIANCGCRLYTQYWARDHASECSMNEMRDCAAEYMIAVQQNTSAIDCGCTVPCAFSTYDLAVSYAAFPNEPSAQTLAQLMNQSVDYVVSNHAEFEIYYKTMSYSTFTQSKKVSESSLLSDIGGQLGLWLGMSVVTAIEIIQFLVTKTVRKKKSAKVLQGNVNLVHTRSNEE